MTRHRALGTAAVATALYGLTIRPKLLTWGATREEAALTYPGDDLVPDAPGPSTMATTLPAPPEKVWPWLVQMGCGRAGWYSWDRLDNGGRPSADRIAAEWQDLKEGSRVLAVPSGDFWFTVAALVPDRTLVLRMDVELPSGHPFDIRYGPLSGAYFDGVWGFHLRQVPGDRTRLVVRTRGRGHPLLLTRPLDLLLWEPVHLVMQARQFRNLRTRVGAEA